MGGRKSHYDKSGAKAGGGKRNVRGNSRGHGAHHRPGDGSPRKLATGKDRTLDPTGVRRRNFTSLSDDSLADLSGTEKKNEIERSVQSTAEAGTYGKDMVGQHARAIVVEVRKGNFLARLTEVDPALPGFERTLPKVLRCIIRGVLQQFDAGISSLVAAGDEVELMIPPSAGETALHRFEAHGILLRTRPRRTEFTRLHPSGRSIQTIAANADQIAVVASTAEPDFRPGFVDRVLVCAAACGLPVAIVLNKIDMGLLDADTELLDVYRSLGHRVFLTSTRDATLGGPGLAELKAWMAGKRTVLTGHSGVGKSSLMLALDSELKVADVRTGDVSVQTGKGTHTTTHAKVFEVDFHDGTRAEIVDTPGVREFTPADTDKRNLWGWFPELARLQGQCMFADCSHRTEKGCAVLAAVERGEIHPRRHLSYVRIYETLPG